MFLTEIILLSSCSCQRTSKICFLHVYLLHSLVRVFFMEEGGWGCSDGKVIFVSKRQRTKIYKVETINADNVKKV